MSDAVATKGITGHVGGWIKGIMGLFLGVGSGVVVMYSNAIVNSVVKPTQPVANFSVSTDGLTVTCQNHASGDSGWWDFGDGSTLDPFDAAQPNHTHTYAKPGNYSVKLMVRNFLMEEKDRTVPVDLTNPPKSLPPTISALKVEALGGMAIAPAGFHITADVQNADQLIFDVGGDKPLVVETQAGPFEKSIVLDKPGSQVITLTAMTGKVAVKKTVNVEVKSAPVGSVSVVLTVADSGSEVVKRNVPSAVAIPLPKKGETRFERIVTADAGYTIAAGTVGKTNPAVVKNVKVELLPDRKSAKLIGEWAAAGDALAKAAGNADAMVPFTLNQERTVDVRLPATSIPGYLTASTTGTTIALPPQRLGLQNPQRKIQMQIARTLPDGSQEVLVTEPDLKFPWKGVAVSKPGVGFSFGAALKGDQLQVLMNTTR